MDCSIELKDNKKNLEQRAYAMLSYLIQDRLKFQEISNEMGMDEEDPGRQSKKKHLDFDSMFQ